jgi:hypothetical protein
LIGQFVDLHLWLPACQIEAGEELGFATGAHLAVAERTIEAPRDAVLPLPPCPEFAREMSSPAW